MDPLIITVARTNVKWTKKDSPYLPETPEEIAEDTVKACQEDQTQHQKHGKGSIEVRIRLLSSLAGTCKSGGIFQACQG